MDKCKLTVISQERLKIEVKLLLSADRQSYMLCPLAQQRMTLSDLEWPFHALRAISAVAELFVLRSVFSVYVSFFCNCCFGLCVITWLQMYLV